MYFIASGTKLKGKLAFIALAVAVTALLAVLVSLCFSGKSEAGTECSFDLKETGGVGGFLSGFSLDYERQVSQRELTLPSKDDKAFAEYGEFQSSVGLNILKFSGKKVEERYLKLKNKSKKGKALYAVLYIYKDRVIGAHLTTLEEGVSPVSIKAFV